MIDITKLSSRYAVRALSADDAQAVLEICLGNPLFYRYTDARPTRDRVLQDMTVTPPGVDRSKKYYFGFFENGSLVAVMDLIDGYPKPEIAYIGFFMVDRQFQGKQIGSSIIGETAAYLCAAGKTAIRLAIDDGNPQSGHFWRKNGFKVIAQADVNGWTKLVAERPLTDGTAGIDFVRAADDPMLRA